MTREERVLGWVNKTREGRGKRPLKRLPKGIIGDECACPIARSFAPLAPIVEADESGVFLYGPDGYYGAAKQISLPKYVAKFIVDFDQGKFPHLTVKG